MGLGDSYQTSGQIKVSEVEAREHESPLLARRTVTIPLNMQERYDYGSRTDGQPEYAGYGARGLATSSDGWLLFKYTYDASGNMTLKQVAYDSWDNRASASYA